MGAIPYAFSVHHFISTVGADAGFAAIIGLAILILLYFSQARETASLREWAAESAQHVQELESRIAQLTRAQGSSPASASATTAPAPAPHGVLRGGTAAARAGAGSAIGSRAVAPGSAAVAASVPAAPAGVGAPALSAATRLIPSSDHDPISIRAGSSAGLASQDRPLVDGDTMMAPPGPPPATAAGAANGNAPPRAPAPAAGSLPSQRPAQAPRRSESTAGARSAGARPGGNGPRRPVAPPSRAGSPSGGRSRLGRGVIAVLALLALAAVVVVVLVLTSGGGNSANAPASSASQTASSKTHHRRTVSGTTSVTPSSVTIAVLNGTSTTNLAHTVAGRLTAVGFKEGTVATASDQTHTSTLVGYLPHHRAAALIVAESLKLGSASVQPVDQSSQTVACPSSSPCSAQVVVTVGSDLAANT